LFKRDLLKKIATKKSINFVFIRIELNQHKETQLDEKHKQVNSRLPDCR
jgi:hypothetical protein